ncbi:hypothetical protein E4U31_008164 [Claviceps sp. LM219 group G6]|nr:hypothetical protein E4U31_008164 [Claviceps sp. LM219 group G6]
MSLYVPRPPSAGSVLILTGMSRAKDCEIATELEQLAAFRNAKGSKASVFVDRQTNIPLPIMAEAPRPAAPALRLDRDGDVVMGGVNALSAVMDSVHGYRRRSPDFRFESRRSAGAVGGGASAIIESGMLVCLSTKTEAFGQEESGHCSDSV